MSGFEINPCEMQTRLDQYVGMVQEKNRINYFKAMNFTFSDPPRLSRLTTARNMPR